MNVTSQVSIPPVPLPQFAKGDFDQEGISLFNTTVSRIVQRANALTPTNPNVRLKRLFIPQFEKDDFQADGLGFVNNQLDAIVNGVNDLIPKGDTAIQAVKPVQLKREDFADAGIPLVQNYLVQIISALNSMPRI